MTDKQRGFQGTHQWIMQYLSRKLSRPRSYLQRPKFGFLCWARHESRCCPAVCSQRQSLGITLQRSEIQNRSSYSTELNYMKHLPRCFNQTIIARFAMNCNFVRQSYTMIWLPWQNRCSLSWPFLTCWFWIKVSVDSRIVFSSIGLGIIQVLILISFACQYSGYG